MKKYKIFLIVSFIFILVFPMLSYPFLKSFDTETVDENRQKASFPKINSAFFTNFNNYFDDNLPFRSTYIKLYKKFNKKTQTAYKDILDTLNVPYYIENNNVIYGKDDWLFYSGDNSMYQYTGINLPTENELAEISQKVQKVGNYFKSQGKEFLLFIAPNKEEIYSEYMPDAIKINSKIKRLDMIADYIKNHTDVKIVYPRQELLNAKSMGQLYCKYDTHWNQLGAYIGASAIFEALNIDYDKNPAYASYEAVGGDMFTMIAETPKADTYYNVNYKPEIAFSVSVNITSDANTGKTLVYFGDSYRNAMAGYLGKEFDSAYLNHFNTYNRENLHSSEFESATTVIFECVGRYEGQIYSQGGLLDRFIAYNNL